MTPPERPVTLSGEQIAARVLHWEHAGDTDICARCSHRAHVFADQYPIVWAAAAEPLRGALDPLRRAIEELPVERIEASGPIGKSLAQDYEAWVEVISLDQVLDLFLARAALETELAAIEATAPSTPEPALDVERMSLRAEAHRSHPPDEHPQTHHEYIRDDARSLAREYAASEPRAAAPQDTDAD